MALEFDGCNIHETVPSESRTSRLVALWSFIVAAKRCGFISEYACRWALALVRDSLFSCLNDIHFPPTRGRS